MEKTESTCLENWWADDGDGIVGKSEAGGDLVMIGDEGTAIGPWKWT